MHQPPPIPPKVILFDCWYTLFTSDLRDDLAKIGAALGVPYSHDLRKTFERSFMLKPYDTLEEPARILAAAYGRTDAATIKLIASQYATGLRRQRAYPDTLDTLAGLHQTYRLGLLTNSFSLSLTHLRDKFHLDQYFDLILPSYEVGAIKPDPLIYKEALRRFGVTPAEAVMVGDSLEDDILPARRYGLRAILLDREQVHPDDPDRVTTLTALKTRIPAEDQGSSHRD
jgi:HAD superfamily hydrolase (TIGR01549 family)